jgi:hypothetical protein
MSLAPLTFKVAPHIVEDLGLNLYTSLPRVLVEFVANAYDADSPFVKISLNHDAIYGARQVVKKQFELEKEKHATGFGPAPLPLETRVLPSELQIVIEDAGHGMSRADLNSKFLFAGRRRRREEPESHGRSPKGRPLMGRKGLGKLAGFGVAKHVQVTSKRSDESHATSIDLNYDDLIKNRQVHEIPVPESTHADGAGIAKSGTRIVLSQLLYDPLKSRLRTLEEEIAEFFWLIDTSDFAIFMNDKLVQPLQREFAYAWPEPDDKPVNEFVTTVLPREGGGELKFAYRIRFTGKDQALEAEQRGVRVYAHKRLAAMPSLLSVDTNIHGFHQTHYLDGVVHADFIDEEDADYISTDRGGLRWESPLLAGLHTFLTEQMKEACKRYQAVRDIKGPKEIEDDTFTQSELQKHDLSQSERRLATRFAVILEKSCMRGVKDSVYKHTLPQLIQGIGRGTILSAITALARQKLPKLDDVVHELVRLTEDELDQFISAIQGRLKGINALKKIVEDEAFRKERNEKRIQKLFEKCPWLVDPTYTQFLLAADVSLATTFNLLAKELGIGSYASVGKDPKEPDLVFLIGNTGLHRLVIVELKASNIPLEAEHLDQLLLYMQRAQEWLEEEKGVKGFQITGHLIGTMPHSNSRAAGALALRYRIREAGPSARWSVRDFLSVLNDTQAAHSEVLEIHKRASLARD